MADDILAQFRKGPRASTGAAQPPKEADEYQAFDTKDKIRRLRILNATPMTNALGYNLLLNVVSDGSQGTHFILVFTILQVLVQGKNLQKMIFAIENHMADYIQEFDPERWQKPKDPSAPIIESIEIKVADGGAGSGEVRV